MVIPWWMRFCIGWEVSWEWNPANVRPRKWLLSWEASMTPQGNNPHAWVRVLGLLIGVGLAWAKPSN